MLASRHRAQRDAQRTAGSGWRRAGASSLEFAIVGSVFFMIVLGIIEVGRGFMVQHLLTNAARQGCRVGVLPGKSTADIAATVNGALLIAAQRRKLLAP